MQVVVNFDAPRSLETYLHRIGRTARAGATGAAVTFIEDDDRMLLKEVVKKGKVNLKQRIVPQQVGGGGHWGVGGAWNVRIEMF